MTSDEELIRRMNDAVGAGDLGTFAEGLHPGSTCGCNRTRSSGRPMVLFSSGLVRGKMHSKHSTTEAEIVTPYEQRFEVEEGLLVRARMTFSRIGDGV